MQLSLWIVPVSGYVDLEQRGMVCFEAFPTFSPFQVLCSKCSVKKEGSQRGQTSASPNDCYLILLYECLRMVASEG